MKLTRINKLWLKSFNYLIKWIKLRSTYQYNSKPNMQTQINISTFKVTAVNWVIVTTGDKLCVWIHYWTSAMETKLLQNKEMSF